MNAFSTRGIVDYDVDMEATAATLNERARALIAAGHMPEAAYRSCVTLKDLRVLVENVTAAQRDTRTVKLADVGAGNRRYCIEITRNGKTRYYPDQTTRRAAIVRSMTKAILYSGGLRIAKS